MKVVHAVHAYLSNGIRRVRQSPAETLDAVWDFARRYFFTLAFLSLFLAKFLHLYAHIYSLPLPRLFLWGLTFFFQDVMILLLFRILAQKVAWRPGAAMLAILVIPSSLIMSFMAAANTSFYVFTGAEIHWRQAKAFNGDAAAIHTLLSGLTGFLIVEGILLTISLFAAHSIHALTGGILHVWAWPVRWLWARVRPHVEPLLQRFWPRSKSESPDLPDPRIYEQINMDDNDDLSDNEEGDHLLNTAQLPNRLPESKRVTDGVLQRTIILGLFSLFLFLRFMRPWDPIYMYMSTTLPLTTVIEGAERHSPVDTTGVPGNLNYLEQATALRPAPRWSWMSKEPITGFEDWDQSDPMALHYNPNEDPLHISNLDQPVLEEIHKALSSGEVKIKHVVFLKLESARADIFPLQKDSFMYKRIAESWKDKKIPQEVVDRLANLTRTAEFLTNFPNGFEHDDSRFGRKAYGGISARDAITSATYTLKSLTGSFCGVTPLVADFNREFDHHIYQPCLPHVFDALSQQPDITSETDDFTKWPWHSTFMMSVTETYDNQDKLTPQLGFRDKQTKETIIDPKAKYYPVKSKEVNYYGYPETELRGYIRDAIDDAERDHHRLFLTHLTSTTHHPWGIPNDAFEEIMGSKSGSNNDMNRYLNSVGYVDDWLSELIGILEEKGVANETLFVMAGDHGLSLPNDGGITPYDNPHVGSFKVPIVLAHPQLPPVQIDTPVINSQIVPTIIDLLIESASLSEDSTRSARDLRSLYEGQSLIRPQVVEHEGREAWHFTVMNTGGSWLSVRSAAKPEFRLVIPLVNDVEWRFSDVSKDPNELKPIERFSLVDLAAAVELEYDEKTLEWLYNASYVANWWVLENWDRWRYSPKEEEPKKDAGHKA
ncbi:Alkaline phosphatase-like alpha/beta/alpha [Penicillium robsamsonii]|uniref:Alkaline phosphatase-like alpha/beta/alpha n=1 Tax=Penicillium robsamsonii TaxID=1792511 RepID=UPI002548A535|nr:Alkaline phosphatase-like alpha/beta/alpha [Penicillium robsamsonii]KAJ5810784.1 Alkaline phosphatase-like alpha/beta/alpha [Penicillium robsamsonii]